MRRTGWVGLVLLVLSAGTLLSPRNAGAEGWRGWYLTTGLGLNQLDLIGNEDLGANLGVRGVAAVGFRFNRHWALELDSGFIRNGVPQPAGPDAVMWQMPIVVAVVFQLPNASRFEPFVGTGLGGTEFFAGDATGMDYTLAFKGGVRREVTERVAIGIDYTYFMWGTFSLIFGEPTGNDTVNLTLQWRP